MTAIDFPNSPSLNQQFTVGGTTWSWNGTAWAVVRTSAGATGPTGPTGPTGATGPAGAITFAVTNSGSGAYVINGASNPTLTVIRGMKYTLAVNASGHPFWIQTVSGAYSSGNIYNVGVTNNGTAVGSIVWEVAFNAPNTLYYACQYHSPMQGTILVTDGVGPSGPSGPSGASGPSGPSGPAGTPPTGFTYLVINQEVSSGNTVTFNGLSSYNRFKVFWYRANGGSDYITSTGTGEPDHMLLITVNGGLTPNARHASQGYIGYMEQSNFWATAHSGVPQASGTEYKGLVGSALGSASPFLGTFRRINSTAAGNIEFFDNLSTTGAKSFISDYTGRTLSNWPIMEKSYGTWDNINPISSITFDLLYGSTGSFGNSGNQYVATYFTVLGSTT